MADNRKRNRMAYLDAFKKDGEGKYFYAGKFYVWQEEEGSKWREIRSLWCLAVLLFAVSAAACCVPAPGTADCAYVLLPCVAVFLGSISVCWGMCRLGTGVNPVRAYVYQASIEQIPLRAVCVSTGAGISIAGELIFVLRNGLGDKMTGAAWFFLLESIALAAAVNIRRHIKKMDWKAMENE